jgi:ribonuclease D
LRSWRNTTAKARGVEPDVILPNDILRMIAIYNPTNCADLEKQSILGDWQLKSYGNLIIEKLQQI